MIDAGTARFTLTSIEEGESSSVTLAEEVRHGLTARPKQLPCRFFYDAEGSQIFEEICELPEYYVTRAEREILERNAGEIIALAPDNCSLVELGSGSATKTRLLIETLLRRQGTLRYLPVDISRTALEESSRQLLDTYAGMEIHAVAAEYQVGLRHLAREAGQPKLILWLGSNIGNLERDEASFFLQQVRRSMRPEDRLLIGIDLRKDRAVLEPAYDDARGVTARFNKNLLARINHELGGHFALDSFDHRAVYDEVIGRVEMYLVSRHAQTVPIDQLGLEAEFDAGEPIHTENSYKYSDHEIHELAANAGFQVERSWYDAAMRFSENLFRPAQRSLTNFQTGT
jgi:L-histidine Nalpha-methyltransferase